MIVAAIVILAILSGFFYAIFFGAPWVPAHKTDINALLDLAKIKNGDKFCDLGCGAGGIMVAAAKKGAITTGYEINPILWFIAWFRTHQYGGKVYLRSFWKADLSSQNIIYTFLLERFMDKLEKKLSKECKKGTIFLSYTFHLPNRKATATTTTGYLYKF